MKPKKNVIFAVWREAANGFFAQLERFFSWGITKVFMGRYRVCFKPGYMTICEAGFDNRLIYSSAWSQQAQQMLCFFIPWAWLVSPAFCIGVFIALVGPQFCSGAFPSRRMLVLGFAVRLTATVLFTGLSASLLGLIGGVALSKSALFGLGLCCRLFCMRYPRLIQGKYVGITGVSGLAIYAFLYQFPLLISPALSAMIVSLFFCATLLRIDNQVGAAQYRRRIFLLYTAFWSLCTSVLCGLGLLSFTSFLVFVFMVEKDKRLYQKKVSDFFDKLLQILDSQKGLSLEDICSRHGISVEDVWQTLANKTGVDFRCDGISKKGLYDNVQKITVEKFNALYPKIKDGFSQSYELNCIAVNQFVRMMLESQRYARGRREHDIILFNEYVDGLIRELPMVFETWVELAVISQIDNNYSWGVVIDKLVDHPQYGALCQKIDNIHQNRGGNTFFSLDDRSQLIAVYQMLSYWRLGFSLQGNVGDSSSHSRLVGIAADILSKPACQYPKWQVYLSVGFLKSRFWSNFGTAMSFGSLGRISLSSDYFGNGKQLGGLRGIAGKFLAACNLSPPSCIAVSPASLLSVNSPHVLVDVLFLHSQKKLVLDMSPSHVDAFMQVFSKAAGYRDDLCYSLGQRGFEAWFRLFSGSKFILSDAILSDAVMFHKSVFRIATALKCLHGKVSTISSDIQCQKICSDFVSKVFTFCRQKYSYNREQPLESLIEVLRLWKTDEAMSVILIKAINKNRHRCRDLAWDSSASKEEVEMLFNEMPARVKLEFNWREVKDLLSSRLSSRNSAAGAGRQSAGTGYHSAGTGYRSAGTGYRSAGTGYHSAGTGRQSTVSSYHSTGTGRQLSLVKAYNRLIDLYVPAPKTQKYKLSTVVREVTMSAFKQASRAVQLELHPDKFKIKVPSNYTPKQASDFRVEKKAQVTRNFQLVNHILNEIKLSFGFS